MDYDELLSRYEELQQMYADLQLESAKAFNHYIKCNADSLAVRNRALAEMNRKLSSENSQLSQMNQQLELAIVVEKNKLQTSTQVRYIERKELENNHQIALKEVNRLQGLLIESENSLDDLQASHNKLEAETIGLYGQIEALHAENECLRSAHNAMGLNRRARPDQSIL